MGARKGVVQASVRVFKQHVQEERHAYGALQSAKGAQEKDFDKLRDIMEEVTDQEIDELRAK